MSELVDMSIKDFTELLSSSAPALGGGSTAALAGSFGAALAMMVVNLSVGKKSYEALDGQLKQEIKKCFEALQGLKDELSKLVDEDSRAFKLYMEAVKTSGDTKKAMEYALEVPMQSAGKCLEVLINMEPIAKYGNKNAASDIGVGALLALSGLEGAALNVRTNIPWLEDEQLKQQSKTKIAEYLEKGRQKASIIREIVESRI